MAASRPDVHRSPSADLPPEVATLLAQLTTYVPVLLGDNVVGLYLYGSLTQQAFEPARSDIDCIVVTEHDLTDEQFEALRAWLTQTRTTHPLAERLQMLFLIKDFIDFAESHLKRTTA